MSWWENAEAARAGRYEDPADYAGPTRAEVEADERELSALRRYPNCDPVERDIIADLIASVEAAKRG